MDETILRENIKALWKRIGKLHAEACSHRLNKDPESMRGAHRQIERRQAEVKENEYLLGWVHVDAKDLLT
jgi:hypothetical protein